MRKKFCVFHGGNLPTAGAGPLQRKGCGVFLVTVGVNFSGLVCVPAGLHLFPLFSFNGNKKAF